VTVKNDSSINQLARTVIFWNHLGLPSWWTKLVKEIYFKNTVNSRG
jgi:hypothetical protein